MITAWTRALGELASTRAHRRFLAAHSRILTLNLDGIEDKDNVIALYPGDGNVYVNERIFDDMASRLAGKGVEEDEVVRLVARKTVSHVAHELCHGMFIRRLRASAGETLIAGSVEQEALCYRDEAAVLDEAQRRWPDLAEHDFGRTESSDAALLESWRKGPKRLYADVAKLCAHFPTILSTSNEELAKTLKNRAAEFRKDVEAYRAVEDVSRTGDAAEKRAADEALAKLPSKFEMDRRLLWAQTTEKFLEDPQRVERMRKFVRAEMKRFFARPKKRKR